MASVSVIMPVFNAAKTLSVAVTSVINQTYTDWELIIIDDKSTDDSLRICRKFEDVDSRIKVLSMPKNVGAAAVRNIGIKYANGQYLAFIDSDDSFKSVFLEKMVMTAENFRGGVDIVWSNYDEILKTGEVLNREHKLPLHTSLSSQFLLGLFFSQDTDGLGCMWNKLYKTSFVRSSKVQIDERMSIGEDWLFNMMLFEQAPIVVAIPDHLYNYIRQNTMSVMGSYKRDYFELMCLMRQRLLDISMKYSIKFEKGQFWDAFIYNTISYLALLLKKEHDEPKERFFNVLSNKMLLGALENSDGKSLPVRYRLIRMVMKLKCNQLTWQFLKISGL